MLAKCSYGPYARGMLRICSEETFHKKQGQELVIRLARGTPAQRAMAQEALNRWWWPTLMQFGYPDAESPHTETLRRWGVKTKTNDELRETFIAGIVPELRLLGLEPPDPELRFDEATGRWHHGPIDFDELKRVVNGDGPCNKHRLGERIKAHEEGAWVREALLAYNARHEQRLRELSGAAG
jgi:ring-1,2-phenylacetyl-CoA epoxidase subunit PaaA